MRKRLALILPTYGVLYALCFVTAFLLRFDFQLPEIYQPVIVLGLPVVLGIKFCICLATGEWRRTYRYTTVTDLFNLIVGGAVAAGFSYLALQLALVAAVALVGYGLSQGTERWLGDFRLPTFVGAFLAAVVLKQILCRVGAYDYVDARTMVRIGGTCTDILVVFGIASINIAILVEYAYPLLGLLIFGVVLNGLVFRYWGPRAFTAYWFEKSLYTWGWGNGVMAMAIALLRTVDPESESHLLDDFALAYVGFGPIEAALVALAPILVIQGQGWPLVAVTLGISVLVLVLVSRYRPRMDKSGLS